MFGISKETVKIVKERYPVGSRVELIFMSDPYENMPPGLTGTVVGVDDIATIHVNWDNGSSLGVCYGEDSCRLIEE